MDNSSPPSYEEANSGHLATPLIIQLHQHAPGRLIDRHLMSSGKLMAVKSDAILLPSSITYNNIVRLLHRRALDRSGLCVPSKDFRFFCRVMIDIEHERVLLDQGSWKAARDILRRREDAQLKFMFSIVPVTYTGNDVVDKVMRRLRGLEYNQTCLVEPALPDQEES